MQEGRKIYQEREWHIDAVLLTRGLLQDVLLHQAQASNPLVRAVDERVMSGSLPRIRGEGLTILPQIDSRFEKGPLQRRSSPAKMHPGRHVSCTMSSTISFSCPCQEGTCH